MKQTLILSKDSNYYYYILLQDGKKVEEGEIDWYIYKDDASGVISDLVEKFGEIDYIYWI